MKATLYDYTCDERHVDQLHNCNEGDAIRWAFDRCRLSWNATDFTCAMVLEVKRATMQGAEMPFFHILAVYEGNLQKYDLVLDL